MPLVPPALDAAAYARHRQSMRLRCRPLLFAVLECSFFVCIASQALSAQTPRPAPVPSQLDLHLPTPAAPSLRSLFLVGDSAVSSGSSAAPALEEGWGRPLTDLFDPTKINVVNRAVASSSSRGYIAEGYWAGTLVLVKSGDVVLIQFGQNEASVPTAVHSSAGLQTENTLPGITDDFAEIAGSATNQPATVHSYGWYLREMVVDTIARGATPIVCSPIPHREWQAGHIRQSTATYTAWAKAIATQQRVPFLDLNAILATRYDALGETSAAPLFSESGTNTSAAGAEQTAALIVAALKGLNPDPLNGFFSAKADAIPAATPPQPPPLPPSQQPHL